MTLYRVEFKGIVSYVRARTVAQAKYRVMRAANAANWWSPGDSLAGLRAWAVLAAPEGEVVYAAEK